MHSAHSIFHIFCGSVLEIYYASPSSGDAYNDRQVTHNFELWVEFFCVPTCFQMRIPKPCLSVRTPRKEIALASLTSVLLTPTVIIDSYMDRT